MHRLEVVEAAPPQLLLLLQVQRMDRQQWVGFGS
jgi:hypothetical protein